MLILTRKMGESIIINDNIIVTIIGSTGHQIKVGIDAPKEISVHREEIYKKIKEAAVLAKKKQVQEESKDQ